MELSFSCWDAPLRDAESALYINQLTETGDVPDHVIENLRHQYGLNQPWYVRYWKWMTRFVRGDMGYSLAWHQPVRDLIGARLLLSMMISFSFLGVGLRSPAISWGVLLQDAQQV